MPDVFHAASVCGKRQYNPVGRISLTLVPAADPFITLEREEVSATRLAPTSGQVVTQFQSSGSRPGSPVRLLYTQPPSPVADDSERAAAPFRKLEMREGSIGVTAANLARHLAADALLRARSGHS